MLQAAAGCFSKVRHSKLVKTNFQNYRRFCQGETEHDYNY